MDINDRIIFLYFFWAKIWRFKKKPYLCTAKLITVVYGVMVTQQILVLLF